MRRLASLLLLIHPTPQPPSVAAVHERETGGQWQPDGKAAVNTYYTGHKDMLVPCSFETLGVRCTSAGNHRVVLDVAATGANYSAVVADLEWRRAGPCVPTPLAADLGRDGRGRTRTLFGAGTRRPWTWS